MKLACRLFAVLVVCPITFVRSAMVVDTKKLVAVTGSTGNLGRRAVVALSNGKVPTRCLVRQDVPAGTTPDVNGSKVQVAAYLASLPGVELVVGDVTEAESVEKLMKGCSSVLSLHGPVAVKPAWKSLVPPILGGIKEDDKTHSRMINYVGVQNIIDAAKTGGTCRRIVRITGKGEDPMGIFSILINMLGTMAKAWNYEGEQLLRQSGLDYTIIRPGIMGTDPDTSVKLKTRALKDNGEDLPVTRVSYDQIAQLSVECLDYDNAAKSTLVAMNTKEEGEGEASYDPLLAKVRPDRREFPTSLLAEHKKAARLGATVLVAFLAVAVNGIVALGGKLMELQQ